MVEMMLFPKTWKEFEEQYGFYDSKQAYMYGNTRLIPSFRVQQWLDHIDDIKRKKQLQENKMQQVAAMFGKELRKPFYVKKDTEHIKVVFTEYGLTEYLRAGAGFELNSELLMDLLTGRAVIVDE